MQTLFYIYICYLVLVSALHLSIVLLIRSLEGTCLRNSSLAQISPKWVFQIMNQFLKSYKMWMFSFNYSPIDYSIIWINLLSTLVRLRDSGILAFFFVAYSSMNQFWIWRRKFSLDKVWPQMSLKVT